MIKTKIQVITSKFGKRFGFKFLHLGIDERIYDENNPKLPAILPEECEFVRRKYQKRWGWTLVFKPCGESATAGYCYLKFSHVENNEQFIPGYIYPKGKIVGHTVVTPYMKKKGYGDHCHFETWKWGKIRNRDIKIVKLPRNPEIYYQIKDIPHRRK